MFRIIVMFLGATLVVSVVCVIGWFLSRMGGDPDQAIVFARILKVALYVMVGACVYAASVGIYHTFLSVTGLDRGGSDSDGGQK